MSAKADYCLITDNSQKDGYGAHVYDCQVVSDAYLATEADCTSPPPTTIPACAAKQAPKPLSMASPWDTAGENPRLTGLRTAKPARSPSPATSAANPESLAATVTSQMTTAPTCTAKV